jgi:nicotinate-nucleotide adenylyltransferase
MNDAVGLIGGSFDPIHLGHLLIARHVAEALDLARVVFVPSAHPPHKRPDALASVQHRLEMVRLAIAGEPAFDVSDWEASRAGPNYTIDTITQFRAACGPEPRLHWIIGSDSLAELATWKDVPTLVAACRIVTVPRPGAESPDLAPLQNVLSDAQVAELRRYVLDTPRIDISSTDIRRRVGAGLSIRYLVPEPVRQYILAHGLYRP